MFLNSYEKIGSKDKNLILETAGKIKILYGKKAIDLLNNKGGLNIPVTNTINKIDSLDNIKNEGFYLLDNFLYAYSDGSYIRLGEFKELDENDWKLKQIDIGLRYTSISEALNALNNGIVLIEDSLYEIKNKEIKKISALNNQLSQINELKDPKEGDIIYFINNLWKYMSLLLTLNLIKKRLAVVEKELNITYNESSITNNEDSSTTNNEDSSN